MKTFRYAATILLFLMITSPALPQTAIQPEPPATGINAMGSSDYLKARVLIKRLDEINRIDKSTLTQTEKRKLRKEVQAINKSMKDMAGGVYLSVGAIIIIILLLILLL